MTRKHLAIPLLLLLSLSVNAQRYTQYFTNTLYESFENPAQGVFKPDTTRMFAFNFFVPNFTANAYLTGDAQRPVKQYLFLGSSKNPGIQIGQTKLNHIYANTNVYIGMLRMFTSLNGNQEAGLSAQIRGEGKGLATDESIALFDGGSGFHDGSYTDLFNDKLRYQTYHQFSITYRESINRQFAVGVKLSALSGIAYNQFTINRSNVTFDKANERMFITLAGTRKTNLNPNEFSGSTLLPTFRSPGASISIGISQQNDDGIKLQYNLKDIGFIHWSAASNIYRFNSTQEVDDLTSSNAGKHVFDAANDIFNTGGRKGSFNTTTDGRMEVSAAKSYWLDWNKAFSYTPVVIASKQVFDRGFIGTVVNNVQYRSVTVGVSASYNDMKQLYVGGQFMVKSPNAEFFIGCEQLYPGSNFAASAVGSNSAINKETPYTAVGFFMGFSLKFGHEIESHPNASYIPMGQEGGLISRLLHGIF